VFQAGTSRADSGEIVTAGGRVMTVVGLAETIATARKIAYEAVSKITFEGRMLRTDIATRDVTLP
jgi:phosphoribosylamine--glycine ligase